MLLNGTRVLALGSALLALAVASCGDDDDDDGGTGGSAGAAGSIAGGAGGAAGDQGTGGSSGAAPEETVELFSWWSSGGELEALEALINYHGELYPNATVVNRAADYATADDARDTLRQRMAQGNPPDSFQANVGGDLLQWVGATAAETLLESLDSLASENSWQFPAAVRDAASSGGSLYGLPVGIHRINTLYYSIALFDENGITPPTTLEEFRQACRDLKAAGVTPLGLGNMYEWTLPLVVFEMIMPAVAGADYYVSFWSGGESPDDPEVADTLAEALWLYCGDTPASPCNTADGYFNADVDTIDWTDALQMMIDGEVAMSAMGDWAKGYFESQGWVAGVDFAAIPLPALAALDTPYVFTADTFNLPKGAPNEAGARRLLSTMGSLEGQARFSRFKGAIPARSDIDPSAYPDFLDAVLVQTIEDFQAAADGDALVIALSGLLVGDALSARQSELRDSLEAGTVDIIADYLSNNYSVLQQ